MNLQFLSKGELHYYFGKIRTLPFFNVIKCGACHWCPQVVLLTKKLVPQEKIKDDIMTYNSTYSGSSADIKLLGRFWINLAVHKQQRCTKDHLLPHISHTVYCKHANLALSQYRTYLQEVTTSSGSRALWGTTAKHWALVRVAYILSCIKQPVSFLLSYLPQHDQTVWNGFVLFR